jgi:hypothetical protein
MYYFAKCICCKASMFSPEGVFGLIEECKQQLQQMRASLSEMEAVSESSRRLLDQPWSIEQAHYAARANVASYDAALRRRGARWRISRRLMRRSLSRRARSLALRQSQVEEMAPSLTASLSPRERRPVFAAPRPKRRNFIYRFSLSHT